jgi:hypothetical protein
MIISNDYDLQMKFWKLVSAVMQGKKVISKDRQYTLINGSVGLLIKSLTTGGCIGFDYVDENQNMCVNFNINNLEIIED